MGSTVQARLDAKTQTALDRIAARHGWSTSKVIRESIHLMDKSRAADARRRPRLIGIGMYDSGVPDLATNPKYMEDFGLDREQVRKKRRGQLGK